MWIKYSNWMIIRKKELSFALVIFCACSTYFCIQMFNTKDNVEETLIYITEEAYGSSINEFKIVLELKASTVNQFPELPTGCEVTSAAMLLNFYGIEVTKEELADKIPKAELPSYEDGVIKGESPNQYFIGDPFNDYSFGVFHKPIYNLLNHYLQMEDMTGYKFQDILDRVKDGYPVLAWVTVDLVDIDYEISWYVEEELFWWPKNEHAVLITDIYKDVIVISDPYGGTKKAFDLQRFEEIWIAMGSQAIAVRKTNNLKY